MTAAWNIAAAWGNIAGNGTLTAFSAATAMPITLLQQEDVSRRWRSAAGTSSNFKDVFASNQSADTFCILGTNLTAAGIVRVRLYPTSADADAGTNVIWDSNPSNTPGTVDPLYEDAIVLASSVQSGWKASRVDLTDTSTGYQEAGYLFISTRTQFTYNYAYGAQRTWVDPSEHKKTRGGQTKIISKPKFRKWQIPIEVVTETQRWALVEAMDIANGITSPVLLIMDPSSTNLGRDSIFGLFTETNPVAYIQGFDASGGQLYSRTYQIEERL
jgi:hypothetical protein